jgi:molybdate transport system ATP-binding protein
MNEVVFSARNAFVKKDMNMILRGVSFRVEKGEVVALVGAAGSGKTTLAQLVAGELAAYGGTVEKGEGIQPFYVPQQDNFFSQTGMTQTYYGQRYEYSEEMEELPQVGKWLEKKLEKLDGKSRKEEIYTQLNIHPLLTRNLLQLSNGERKRTQIALALLHEADLYVMDQPFLGLDTLTRELLRKSMQKLKETGKTVFLVCGVKEIPVFADRVIELERGKIKRIEDASTYCDELEKVRRKQPVASGEIHLPKTNDRPEYGYVVRMRDVHITMQGEPLLSHINWEVRDHERWHLAGHNGSGKSTLLSLITADNPQAYANDISLFGQPRGSGESIWDIKKKIGFVSPELHLYFLSQHKISSSSHTSVRDLPCLNVVVSGFNDEVGFSSRPTQWQESVTKEWMKALGLEGLLKKNFSEISLGEQRMLLLIRALIKNPPLLILDEPCQGIDYEQSQRFIGLLDSICTATDATLIYVSHSPDEIPTCITHRIELEAGTIRSIGKV